MPFYSLGQIDTSGFSARPFTRNLAVPDSSASIIQRNQLSIYSNTFERNLVKPKHDINEVKNKNLNNYLQPITSYSNSEKYLCYFKYERYSIQKEQTNKETYRLEKSKLFTRLIY